MTTSLTCKTHLGAEHRSVPRQVVDNLRPHGGRQQWGGCQPLEVARWARTGVMKREPESNIPLSLPTRALSCGRVVRHVDASPQKRTRGPCKFKQCDVIRAVKAVAKAGVEVARVEIAPDGRIVIATGTAVTAQSDDLDRELADFEATK